MKKCFNVFGSKIAYRIAAVMILITVVSTIIVGMTVVMYAGNMFKSDSQAQLNTIHEQQVKNVNSQFDFFIKQMMYIEIEPDFANLAKASGGSVLNDYMLMSHIFTKYRTQFYNIIDSIYYYRYDNTLFSEYNFYTDISAEQFDFVAAAKAQPQTPIWIYPQKNISAIEYGFNENCISAVKEIKVGSSEVGVLVFNMNVSLLNNIIEDIYIKPNLYKTVIFDDENTIVSSGLLDIDDSAVKSENAGKGMTLMMQKLNFGDYRLATVFSNSLLTSQPKLIIIFALITILLCFIIVFIAAIVVSNSIAKPITDFTGSIKTVIDGEYNVRFNYDKNDEIGVLSDTYNRMLDRTQELMEEVKSERELKIISEHNSLLQQINAHFLYNTLDIIYWMSKNGDCNDAAEITVSLAELLRLSVNSGENLTFVQNEVKHLKKYLFIEKYRYEFEYDINISEDIMKYKVPKLILQPLAENSILHGFRNISYLGKVTINGYAENGNIIFEVTDNGIGFNTAAVENDIKNHAVMVEKNANFALSNIFARFKVVYGREDCISLKSSKSNGTCVKYTLPIID